MNTQPSLDDLLAQVSIADSPCSDEHLKRLGLKLSEWRVVAMLLGLEENEIEDIEERAKSTMERAIRMLRRWRERSGEGATYRYLANVLWDLGRKDVVEKLCEMVSSPAVTVSSLPPSCGPPQSAIQSYSDHLKSRYRLHMPAATLQWPPPPTKKYFNLSLIKKEVVERGPPDEATTRLFMMGRIGKILEKKVPIELGKIFEADDEPRKVILIEGAPGSGKSTLSWHICQKWASGELFQQFSLVVFVQFRDPIVQAAHSIVDLFPHVNDRVIHDAVLEIESRQGQGILFVMDGWDELPANLQEESLFRQLIELPLVSSLQNSALILTSRPDSSGMLHSLVSSRIETIGFTSSEVSEYFTDSLKGDSQAVVTLMEQVRDNPMIEASCWLPLNVAIIVTVFLSMNHTLPATLTDLFISLILCCLARHLKTRTALKIRSLSSLEKLPEAIRKPFTSLCHLAFQGILENQLVFSEEQLETYPDFDSLSLVQAVESFHCVGGVGLSRSYNFIHLSIQELLAAWHISKMAPHDQIEILDSLLEHPRYINVFRFYAGITQLQTPGIEYIFENFKQSYDRSLLEALNRSRLQLDIKVSIKYATLLNCLYEVKNATHYHAVAKSLLQSGEAGVVLVLYSAFFSATDCLSVGSSLSWVSHASESLECSLVISGMDDCCIKALIKGILQMKAHIWKNQPPIAPRNSNFTLFFAGCSIEDGGFSSIAQLLQSPILCQCSLSFLANDMGIRSLQCLTQGLLHSTTVTELHLLFCEVSDEGTKLLAETLMVNKSLEVLELTGNRNISGEGWSYLAESLKCNSTLKKLKLYGCDSFMTEIALESFATALTTNETLQIVKVSSWIYRENDIKEVVFDHLPFIPDSQLILKNAIKVPQQLPAITSSELAALAERLQASGVLQRLLAITIKKSVEQFGEEKTASALANILVEWLLEMGKLLLTA